MAIERKMCHRVSASSSGSSPEVSALIFDEDPEDVVCTDAIVEEPYQLSVEFTGNAHRVLINHDDMEGEGEPAYELEL